MFNEESLRNTLGVCLAGGDLNSELSVIILRELLAARKVIEAARGLSHSTDWNNGTHAKLHGYRQKLLDAIAAYDAATKGGA